MTTETKKNTNNILQLISINWKLEIEALDGRAYIDAKNIFKSAIAGDFKNLEINQADTSTAETLVDVREMIGDGKFFKIFSEITDDLEKIFLTSRQIIRFCEKYPGWLLPSGIFTLFPTKVESEYSVVCVQSYADELIFFRLGYGHIFKGSDRHRVVYRQFSLAV